MFCTACGTKNSAESNFCKQCGTKLEKTTSRISEEDFTRALPDDEQPGVLMERAYTRRMMGDLAGATALCEQALKLHPDSASAHSLLGQIYEQQGDTAKAIQEFETVLAHNPGSIADRVKLDALRGETSTPATSKSPQIVMTSPPNNAPPNIFAMIGVGAALILVGAVAANQLRPTAPVANDTSRDPISKNTPNAGTAALTTGGMPQSATPSNNAQILPGNAGTLAGGNASSSPLGSYGSLGTSSPQSSSLTSPFFPPIQINAAPPRERVRTNVPAVSNATPNTAQPINAAQVTPPKNMTGTDATDSSSGSNRTRLADTDGGVVESDNGKNYVIRVDTSGLNGKNSAANSNTAKNGTPRAIPANTGSEGSGSIKIQMANNGSSGTARTGNLPAGTNGATSDARTAISMARDLSQRGDYARAINAYRKALPTAGDETGYVYQAIAKCYQNKGDSNSAIVNYELAIGEFQKLVEAGRGADTVRAALRICQSGIKACKGVD